MQSTYRDEVNTILNKARLFDTQLQNLKTLNQELIIKSENIITSLNKIVSKINNKCTVCYTRDRNVVFQPCGHCFCSSCADRATSRNRCFTCRQNITNSFKIFLWEINIEIAFWFASFRSQQSFDNISKYRILGFDSGQSTRWDECFCLIHIEILRNYKL